MRGIVAKRLRGIARGKTQGAPERELIQKQNRDEQGRPKGWRWQHSERSTRHVYQRLKRIVIPG